MSGIVAFTTFTLAELARALTLARGLKARHPEWRVCGMLVDRAPAEAPWREAFDAVIEAETLYFEGWRPFVFKHDAEQAPAAARGRALARLLSEGARKVFYFAPDIAVFDDLSDLAARLDSASILLTPHQAEPSDSARAFADNEARALRDGVYSLDFLGVRNDPAGRSLARWWTARLDAGAYDEEDDGAFRDQKHFDLVPALFDRVEVLRDPGCHVASWNLSRRDIEIGRDGRIRVNGEHPLKFYNFANPHGDAGILAERYAGRRLGAYELAAYHRRALAASGAPAPSGEGWAYGRFADGAPIPSAARRLYRREPDLAARFPDPFAAGPESYAAWLRAERADLL